MKFKTLVTICVIGIMVLFAVHNCGVAEPKTTEPKSGLKIGTVSIKKILRECKLSAKYRDEATAERTKIEAELEKLSKEIDAQKAGLKTLKSGSPDYMAAVKDILTKQASLQAQQEFQNRQMVLKEQRIVEEVYKGILEKTSLVAEEKGIDMVFEKSEPELPADNSNELMLTISSHKLLYCKGCVDITDEVMAKLDGKN